VANVNLGLTYLTVAAFFTRTLNTNTIRNSKGPSAVNHITGPNMSSLCAAYRWYFTVSTSKFRNWGKFLRNTV